jgi:mannose-6-phosphate isomerase-like protein (cupin superfamily)
MTTISSWSNCKVILSGTDTDTDEVFIALDGEMCIGFRDGKVDIKSGEMFVVSKRVEHKPSAKNECKVMLVEPAGTIKTGDVGGHLTAEDNVWI